MTEGEKMEKMKSMQELYQKTSIALVGAGLLAALNVCSETRYVQRDDKWYDCNMGTTYPQGHPCYDVVQNYLAAKRARSYSSGTSSTGSASSGLTSKDHNWGDRADKSSSGDKSSGGHKECH